MIKDPGADPGGPKTPGSGTLLFRYCVLYTVDCSAIVEHTKRVIYLEDDDVAAVADGNLTIHRYEYIYTVKKG
jgi:hypothetical protein